MTQDYRIEVKVKNNNLLKKIEAAGYKSVGEFCRLNNITKYTTNIGAYVNLKSSPLNAKGDFYPHIYEICDILQCSPEDLFTETQLNTALETNRRTIEVNEAEMQFMLENMQQPLALEDQIALEKLPEKIDSLLETLTPREAKVLKLRFGLDGNETHTLKEVGDIFDTGQERIRQIEAKALRKLRHPSRSDSVRDYMGEE